jgi:integrase
LGEALSLQWKDIDLTDGVITVLKAKNQKQRKVPVHDSLRELLDNYQNAVDGFRNARKACF